MKTIYGNNIWNTLYGNSVWKTIYGNNIWKTIYGNNIWKTIIKHPLNRYRLSRVFIVWSLSNNLSSR